jgi:hypothetical protein
MMGLMSEPEMSNVNIVPLSKFLCYFIFGQHSPPVCLTLILLMFVAARVFGNSSVGDISDP